MNITFNDKGTPLVFEFDNGFGNTTGSPILTEIEKKSIVQTVDTKSDREMQDFEGAKLLNWGGDNDFPQWADKIISSTGVLNTGLKFIRNFTVGQGLYPCRVTGYNEDGNEILEAVKDPVLTELLGSRMVRRYQEKVMRDYLKFGCGFVQLINNEKGNKIVALNPLNAYSVRLTERSKGGAEKCIISGKWPEKPDAKDADILDVLPDYDPDMELEYRRKDTNTKSVVYAIRDSWSNKENYSEPIWLAAYAAGWITIAQKVPIFLQKVFQNMASLKWHIQIPYSFWDRKFPEADYRENVKKRKDDITLYMQTIESNLTGINNADKPIFTHYAVNEYSNGRIEEEWKITALDGKSNEKEKLVTSAAANSEILFSLMINPNVMGAGMPGGAYAGNQGGSNIREAFLVNIANAWIDRQNILDPIVAMMRYNGYPDVQIRYRNTVLVTLDKNKGTEKTLS